MGSVEVPRKGDRQLPGFPHGGDLFQERDEELLVLRVPECQRMGVTPHDDQGAALDAAPDGPRRRVREPAARVQAHARDPPDRLGLPELVETAPQQAVGNALVHRTVGHPAESIAALLQRVAEPAQAHALPAGFAALGEAERKPRRVIEGLIPGGHEGGHRGADALLQRVLARPEGLVQLRGPQPGEPLVAVRVTADLMARLVDPANLSGVVIRPLARQRGRPDDGEAGRYAISRVDFEETLRVLEFQRTPRLGAARSARPIRAPLGVVIPEEDEGRRLGLQRRIRRTAETTSSTSESVSFGEIGRLTVCRPIAAAAGYSSGRHPSARW